MSSTDSTHHEVIRVDGCTMYLSQVITISDPTDHTRDRLLQNEAVQSVASKLRAIASDWGKVDQ